MKHWNSLSREVMKPSALEVFKKHVDHRYGYGLVCMVVMFSNLNVSMILKCI